jgi:putative solute:sodium symporter small subunit
MNEADNQPAKQPATSRELYWRANSRLIVILLSIWAFVSLGCSILFVEQLNQFNIGNLPAGFWFAQQGSIFVFVVLIFVYAFAMDRLDKKHDVEE